MVDDLIKAVDTFQLGKSPSLLYIPRLDLRPTDDISVL